MTTLRLFTFSIAFFALGQSLCAQEEATAVEATGAKDLRQALLGAWALAGDPDSKTDPEPGARMKFWGLKHWVITQSDPETGELVFHHGGTYTLDGDNYEETIRFAADSTKNLIGMRLAWTVEPASEGAYDIYLDAACVEGSAGNVAAIDGFSTPLEVVIPGTGGWDRYESIHVSRASLAAGRNRIIVRPAKSRLRNALMDLRGLRLVSHSAAESRPITETFDPMAVNDAALSIYNLIEGLAVGTPREYEKIPAIWQEAIAAGRRNHDQEICRVLCLSLPQLDEPAQHWQVVAVGGGIINGLTQAGVWPRPRIQELIRGDGPLQKRWERLLDLSSIMADDPAVPHNTRYDALRILGADTFETRGAQLIRYLEPEVHNELQMGAVSGLGDIDHEFATQALLKHVANLAPKNRELAMDALLRSECRAAALLTALAGGTVPKSALSRHHVEQLLGHSNPALRERAQSVLKRTTDAVP